MGLPRRRESTAGDPIATAGYPAVRQAFNRMLNAAADQLTKADIAMAEDVLALNASAASDDLVDTFLVDTALFSRPGDPTTRARRKRAVDRIAPKLATERDPLLTAIAERLPQAFFSIFTLEERDPDGRMVLKDLLDDGRPLDVMDNELAKSATPGTLFAGRFVDLGPWYVGFGIVVLLKKSEAAAVLIALSHPGELSDRRDALHELVYLCRAHDTDLVMSAIEPLITAMSLAIDTSDIAVDEIASQFVSSLPME